MFLKPIFNTLFDKVMLNRCIATLQSNMSSFESGSQKNKSTNDSLFLLRALIDHCVYLNEEILITFYDFK